MKRADLSEKILDIKREKGWTWKHICAEIGGLSEILITAALLGQMRLPKAQAARAAELFGLTEAEARQTHDCVDIYQTSFRPMKATLSGGPEKVIMKIVVCGETDKVLGVHVLGEGAGEMAQLLAISLRMGATKSDFDATMALHPSAAEELVTLRTRTARHTRDED